MSKYILSIDQGTTSSRAIVFSLDGTTLCQNQSEFPQIYPEPGWVEHDPEVIWDTTLAVIQKCISAIDLNDLVTVGITNQRETTILWDKETGKPIYNAIVWQDRRTADYCKQLTRSGVAEMIQHRTGLVLDPYFSATKICWILDNITGVRQRAAKGEILFGTVDSFLLWRLSKGKCHYTDITNASRTSLYSIEHQCWDDELLDIFSIPRACLPQVKNNTDYFGTIDQSYFGRELPITGMAGDQQAALIGQACFKPGMAKSTYGTGCFLMVNSGPDVIRSKNNLLSTIAYNIDNQICYALEGSIFIAGAVVQWLRDKLGVIKEAKECELVASCLSNNDGVYFVPAFTGLGAPHWDPNARGAILGLTRDTGYEHIVRAALESVCYQTNDLIQAVIHDGVEHLHCLRVDGGMIHNTWLMQMLSDIIQLPIDCAAVKETTALGAAFLAGLGAGVYSSFADIENFWQALCEYKPNLSALEQQELVQGWQHAVEQVKV